MDEQERAYLEENARRIEQWEDTPTAPSGRFSDMTDMEKDKLLDYMFDQNSKLTDQLAGVREGLRLQREQAERHQADLQSRLVRMEELAIAEGKRADAAEKRAEVEAAARIRSDQRAEDLQKTTDSLLDGSIINELKGGNPRIDKAT